MKFIEEDTTDFISEENSPQSVQELVQDNIDSELKIMLDGEPVRHLISGIIDEKLRDYFQGIKVKEHHQGPGRGKIGKTHKKFSASLPKDLFEEVKALPGLFSAHLDASLQLYLKMVQNRSQSC